MFNTHMASFFKGIFVDKSEEKYCEIFVYATFEFMV